MQQMSINEQTILILVGMCYVFAMVLGIIAFFLFRKTVPSLESIIHGPLLPLLTVVVVAIATTFLAVVGVLKENTIAAIFGSIVGYVLGSLTQRTSHSTGLQDKTRK